MAKEVIEPEIITPGQVEPRQKRTQNKKPKAKFYYSGNIGCMGLIIAFFSLFLAIPLLIYTAFKKKKK